MRDQSVGDSGRKGQFTQPGGCENDRHALGYVRVSTDKQAERGLSLEAQTEKIRAMAVVRGANLADVIVDDGASAKSLDRPGMAWLLAQIDNGTVHTVIIAKLDRLTRSVVDLANLLQRFNKRRVSLISVEETLDTGSAIGELILNIMVSVSQWERKAIGERTRDVMRHKKAKGERVGTLPLGFELAADGVHLQPNPVEQDRLATIRDLKFARGLSLKGIADRLNADGLTTRRGTAWRFQSVAHALKAAPR
jgi:site-specific DNA recombinase